MGAEGAGAALPAAAARPPRTQWQLAEDLVDAQPFAVQRLYASPIDLEHAGASFGVFVGFVGGAGDAADAASEWADLRAAAETAPAPWAGVLRSVREHFVARSPDEAFRVR